MANTLTAMVPRLLAQGLLALREQVVMPRLVNRSYEADARQRGSTIDVPIPSAITANDVVPGPTSQTESNLNPTFVQVPLDNWKEAAFALSDKERKEVVDGIFPMQASEAIKSLANVINASVLNEYPGVYGYVGVAGTTPFSADIDEAVDARRVLFEQLCPPDDRRLVIDPVAEGNALKYSGMQDASFRGDTDGIIRGQIGDKMGFMWVMDQQVPTHTAGTITTGLAAKTATAQAIGLETIVATTAASTGACALLEGDIINIAGDSQTYVLTAAATQASAASDVNLAISPPLKVALTGDEAITVNASHTVNLAFHRDAFALASRPLDDDGLADGSIQSVTDPVSGLTLRLEITREHKRNRWSYDVLWGTKLVRAALACRVAG